MSTHARLIPTRLPRRPDGVVLVLHGGASRRDSMRVSPTQLSVLRMIPVAGAVARAGRGRLAVFRVLNSTRGWDTAHTPVDDAVWAMGQVAERLGGELPTCLVGHSLGGRAALLAADRREVRSAVALAPWVYPHDTVDAPGRRILVVHGDRDRVASPERSATVAANLARSADVAFVTVAGGRHAMLRHGRTFEGLAAQFATATLLGTEPRGVVARVLAGERQLTV
jgi:alpha-beta hydrolase superfamily lysophospholipase